MVKGIINAFDHMEFYLVINLTKGGNSAVKWPPIIATRYMFCYYLKNQVASTCYLQKKLISNTDCHHSTRETRGPRGPESLT